MLILKLQPIYFITTCLFLLINKGKMTNVLEHSDCRNTRLLFDTTTATKSADTPSL